MVEEATEFLDLDPDGGKPTLANNIRGVEQAP